MTTTRTAAHPADIAEQIIRHRDGTCSLGGRTVGRITRNEREVWGGHMFSRTVVWDVYAADGRWISESFSVNVGKLNIAHDLAR